MSSFMYFILVLSLSLISSAILVVWQQRAIGPLLDESCPGSGAHYWRHTLAALQFLIPMLLVIAFASEVDSNIVNSLRTALICLLLGHLLAIAAIANTVWKRLVPPRSNDSNVIQPAQQDKIPNHPVKNPV